MKSCIVLIGRCFVIFFFAGLPLLSWTQSFASEGSKWYYLNNYPNYPDNPIYAQSVPVFDLYQVIGDTTIEETIATIIKGEGVLLSGERLDYGNEYVFVSGDSVWVWIEDQFRVVFNFSSQTGDTLSVVENEFNGFFRKPYPNSKFDRFIYQIDSIDHRVVGQDTIEVQYVSNASGNDSEDINENEWGFQDIFDDPTYSQSNDGRNVILKGIGFEGRGNVFGIPLWVSYNVDLVPRGLSCFETPGKFYQFQEIDCREILDFISTDVVEVSPQPISIFPNPVTDYINLNELPKGSKVIQVYNIQGNILKQYKVNTTKKRLDLNDFLPGFYFLKISVDSNLIYTYKIIKT